MGMEEECANECNVSRTAGVAIVIVEGGVVVVVAVFEAEDNS